MVSADVAELVEEMNVIAINASVSTTLHMEVRLKKGASKIELEKHKDAIVASINNAGNFYNWKSFNLLDHDLSNFIDQIIIGCPHTPDGQKIEFDHVGISPTNVHIYNTKDDDGMATSISADGSDETSIASHHWALPCKEFDDLWENLVFDDNIKNELLSFVYALLKLSDRGANASILSVNRMVLLHGPPGTGKTSLCKALAQRLAVRLSHRYKRSIFIEVNSHSVFSKWFSESGKLILKLFEQIEECASDTHQLVFVLIDEVESLTLGRASSFKGNEPSDALRSVNAVLTQMDRIRKYRNVLVLTTSNITDALDEAFIDRADINRFVGHPSSFAIYVILVSAIKELQRVSLVDPSATLDPVSAHKHFNAHSQRLLNLSCSCSGWSGRTIRKLPVLAYSRLAADYLTMDQFLNVLKEAIIEKQRAYQNGLPKDSTVISSP